MAGLYTAASKLPAIMNMFVSVFQQSWQIFSAREYGSDERETLYSVVFRAFSMGLLCCGSIVIALSYPISSVMFGPGFASANVFVPVLMLGAIVNGYSTYFGTIYNAAKKNQMIFVTTVVGGVTCVAVGAILCPIMGAWGPAVGSLLSYAIISIARAIDTRRFAVLGIDWTYQGVGLLILVLEVVVLSLDLSGSFVVALGLSIVLLLFTLLRNRQFVLKLWNIALRRLRDGKKN